MPYRALSQRLIASRGLVLDEKPFGIYSQRATLVELIIQKTLNQFLLQNEKKNSHPFG